ncbi:crossover junction endodeoxyribonuclease RuvC [candidate division CPR3 bacterium 4484_211]|uniref:Crossover junction endodeoxyribonuclease RuvC n=1 Tax=candidate division CPR3 bacterium 4484_211 TaxID=1968527 RepID=A0A1W9NZ63_UNCC3|nr:MAG: crossover junction endodeoxyribonuclease RuvC [candidate division CPR3 bacterium 4484_211]
MTILGIDPGLATTGWGIVKSQESKIRSCNFGIIKTSAEKKLGERLEKIYERTNQLIVQYKPNLVAIEKIFFGKNVKTAIVVGQARGVVLLAGQASKIEICEFTPLQIKLAVCGYGQAAKIQVQKMIKRLLNLKEIPKPDDAADALAVAYTAAVSIKHETQSERSIKQVENES